MTMHEVTCQVKLHLKRLPAVLVLTALTVLVLLNYVTNVLTFRGTDIVEMYDPLKMLTLSFDLQYFNNRNIVYLPLLLSLLAAVPAALSLSKERRIGEDTVVIARIGRKKYYRTRFAVVFIVTAIVFVIPFLVEIALNLVAFPIKAEGDFLQFSIFSAGSAEAIGNYQFSALYVFSQVLYVIVGTLSFGVFAGIIAVFSYSVTLIIRQKYAVFYLLPPFLLIQIWTSCSFSRNTMRYSWINQVFLFCNAERAPAFFYTVISVLLVMAVIFTYVGSKRDL